ncbi:MAG: sulfatase [Maribacter sp.]|nr:sulfatase [Maribacter sp.]
MTFKIIIGYSIWILFTLTVNAQEVDKNEKRPNIIFILSDDHAYQAISAYGHGLNETPNIDRIAKQGAIFNKAFVTNSICAPSRAVILTGKHSFLNGKVDNVQPFDWEQSSFPKLLQSNGYKTALIGKIHLNGLPLGFDYSAVLPGQGAYYNPDFLINGKKERITGYVTDITTDLTLEWLKDQKDDKPFCVFYNQKAPHRRWLPAIRDAEKYTQMNFKQPETLFDDYKNRGASAKTAEMDILGHMNLTGDNKIYPSTLDEMGLAENMDYNSRAFDLSVGRMNKEQRAAWDAIYGPINEQFKSAYKEMSDKELKIWKYQRYMQDYLGTIESVDDGVGKVLDFLEESGLAENTIVIYTADQGFYLGEHGWFDKRFMYEESLRTPLLIRYPKEIKPGTEVNELVQNLDFAPTLLEYAGVTIPSEMQGASFRKLVNKENLEWRDAIYYTYYEYPSVHMVKRHYGVRTVRYKLMHFYYDVDEWEMYDLEKDPQEMNNIYGNPEYVGIQDMMHGRLTEMRKKYGDSDENDQRFLKEYLEAVRK